MSTCLIRCVEVTFIHLMSAYRGHRRSALFAGNHLRYNVQTAYYKRSTVLFSIGPCQTGCQTVRFTRRHIVCTGLRPQLGRRMPNFFSVGGPRLCPCEVKTSIFSINNFHFSYANVNFVGGWWWGERLLKAHCLANNAKLTNQPEE